MKTKKIGIDIRAIGMQRTGDEYYTLNLVREILKQDKLNQYFLFTNTKNTKSIEKKLFSGIKNKNAEIIPVLPKSKTFWTFFALPKMVKKLGLDVLHVQYIAPFHLTKKVKLVTTIADVSFKAYPEMISKSDLFFLNLLIPLTLKRADNIIAVSDFTKKEIVKYYKTPAKKIKTIHNGEASEIFFSKKIGDKRKLLEKIGVKKPFVFYVGTHQPRKDIPTLIKAFLGLKKRYPHRKEIRNLQLVIGGKLKAHNYDLKIDQVIQAARKTSGGKKALKDLIFTGYIEDKALVALYREASVFAFPSLYEGFGLPLIEAMISQTPVVCSRIECSEEVAGNAAMYYKPQDGKGLQRALYEVVMKPEVRKKLIDRGLKNSIKYSWERAAKKTIKILSK